MNSRKTEQQILYVLIKNGSLLSQCNLLPEDFTHETDSMIFDAMINVAANNQPIDLITIGEYLEHKYRTVDMKYLGELVENGFGLETSIKTYADIIKKASRKRQANMIARHLQQQLAENYGGDPIAEAITKLMAVDKSSVNYSYTLKEALHQSVEAIQRAHEMDGIVGIPTGLTDLDESTGGFHNTDLTVIGARPAMGKAQPLTSKVLLANGKFKFMGNIELGDKLASIDGKLSEVNGVYPQGLRPIYKMNLSDGREVEADFDHLWTIESSVFSGKKTVTTWELIDMLDKVKYKNRVRLITHNGEFGEDNKSDISPWLIGFLIGDGCLKGSSIRFSTAEQYILDKIKRNLPKGCSINHVAKYDYRIISEKFHNPVMTAIRNYGLNVNSYDKSIPESLMCANKATRLALLMGLIESDGWSENGGLRFCSSSKKLVEGFQALVRSIGGVATLNHKKNVKYVKNGEHFNARDAFKSCAAFPDMNNLIKSERVSKNLWVRRKTSNPIIRSIEYSRDDLAQCIHVSHKDHIYITDGYTATHNTALLFGMCLASGKIGGIISAEQGAQQAASRFISMKGSLDSQKLRTAQLNEAEWSLLSGTVMSMRDLPIYINDQPAIDINALVRQAREWKFNEGLEILYVDYIQKIKGTNQKDPKWMQVTEVVGSLKNLARELDIPIVALAQVKRDVDTRADKRPQIGDMSDASEIEKEADVIMTLYRDDAYDENSEFKGLADLDVVKNRHGPTGTIRTKFIGKYFQFKDLNYSTYQD